ncbi:hypothetical protein QQ045_010067 [Rhodiola kirilowii]
MRKLLFISHSHFCSCSMEQCLAPKGITSPALPSNDFRLAIQNTQQPCEHSEKDDDDDNSHVTPLASTGSSSPNSQASSGSTNIAPSTDHGSIESSNIMEYAFNSPLPPPPGNAHRETYIVQMPRDQIFRVPPTENSNIDERFRQPLAKEKSEKNLRLRSCLPWLYASAVLFVITGLVILGLQLFLKPQNPEFTLENFVFKNATRPEYDISLIAKNPNKNLFRIFYEGAEDASLLYNRRSLAEGGFPALEQGPNESSDVRMSLSSLKRNLLPVDLEKSLTRNKKMNELEFTLAMEMPIRSKLLVMPGLGSRNMSVKCVFTVDGLVPRSKILAQKCITIVH